MTPAVCWRDGRPVYRVKAVSQRVDKAHEAAEESKTRDHIADAPESPDNPIPLFLRRESRGSKSDSALRAAEDGSYRT